MAESCSLPCEFAEFKEALQQARVVDDTIIYQLNTSIPTKSFAGQVSARDRCKELYDLLQSTYIVRQSAVSSCISISKQKVVELRKRRDEEPDNVQIKKDLRKSQNELRLMENELFVEDVIKDRSIKVFKERCWQAYKPPDL